MQCRWVVLKLKTTSKKFGVHRGEKTDMLRNKITAQRVIQRCPNRRVQILAPDE
jgi:hypothetical protein